MSKDEQPKNNDTNPSKPSGQPDTGGDSSEWIGNEIKFYQEEFGYSPESARPKNK